MEKDDKGSMLIRIGVSGWKFLLVPAYPGCPGSKAVKRSLLLLLLYQILSKSVKRLQRYGDLTGFFSKWRPSTILDLMGADWDNPRRPLDGLYRCAKFGWNWCSSFDNMKLSTFCPFGLKMPIHSPKIGVFLGFHPQNGEQCQWNPQNAHPCASPRRLSHQAWKSVDGSDL